MGLEIEAKVRVDGLDSVRARLRELNAQNLGDTFETNIFLDTSDRRLLSEDRGLRLRRNRHVQRQTDVLIITHKGPRLPGALKTRQEHELEVASEEDAVALLGALGFVVTLRFEKRRQSWKLDDCKIELDEMPRVGSFVEIEGPSNESVLAVQQRLGLQHLPQIKHAYVALLSKWLQDHNDDSRDIRF